LVRGTIATKSQLPVREQLRKIEGSATKKASETEIDYPYYGVNEHFYWKRVQSLRELAPVYAQFAWLNMRDLSKTVNSVYAKWI